MIQNPFVHNIKLEVTKVYTKEPTGEVTAEDFEYENSRSGGYYYYERAEKSSVFQHKNSMDVLYGGAVKSAGRDLLLYILMNLKKDCDFIELKPKVVCAAMDIARSTLNNGVNQLKGICYIAPKSVNVYWINPEYLLNGNRVDYYRSLAPNDEKLEVVFSRREKG